MFRNLTVYECLLMGGLARTDRPAVARGIERMYELFPRLKERRGQLEGTLSGGEQQMLTFARALVAKPRLLLLDEPSMGLAPRLVQDMVDQILRVRDEGVTVLPVKQKVVMALAISDSGYVLETGRVVLSGRNGVSALNGGATSGPNLLRACICAARCRAAACVARQPVDRRWQR